MRARYKYGQLCLSPLLPPSAFPLRHCLTVLARRSPERTALDWTRTGGYTRRAAAPLLPERRHIASVRNHGASLQFIPPPVSILPLLLPSAMDFFVL